MHTNKKLKFLVPIVLCVIIFIAIFCYTMTSKPSTTYLSKQMNDYLQTGEWNLKEVPSSFSKNSAERLFLKGMTYFDKNDMARAEYYFKKAQKKPYTDNALPIYLNIYLNECTVIQTGSGDKQYVRPAMDAMAKSPSLVDDTYWAWYLTYSFIETDNSSESAQVAIEEMERYIKNVKQAKEDKILLLQTYNAILKNISGEYSESILLFHNLFSQANDMKKSDYTIEAKTICIDYIADMYYSYKDYEKASALYLELIDQHFEDPYDNAQQKYSAYINMGNIYVQQKNFDQARQIVMETKKILPYLTEDYATEVNAFLHNILANIELEEGNIEKATAYFQKCQNFLQPRSTYIFFDTSAYLALTQSKIFQATGQLQQAEEVLVKLLADDTMIIDTTVQYDIHKLLSEIYQTTGQESKYYEELQLLLKDQEKRVNQYQADYCEAIDYYDQLLTLQREHTVSLKRNQLLIYLLFAVLLTFAVLIKLTVSKYKENVRDALTGLYNRKKLEKEFHAYEKNNHKMLPYGVIMTDIDFFKRYNDTYGHAAGDSVIKRVASILKQSVRNSDIVIRYGGEELLVLLKNVNSDTLEMIGERIRSNVEAAHIPHKESTCNPYVTLSIGCFYVENPPFITLQEAIKKADVALYASKQQGRNSVTMTSHK